VTERPLPARTRRPGPKQAIRERIWALLERERAARFPGVEGRIPNFAGRRRQPPAWPHCRRGGRPGWSRATRKVVLQ
jgi:hypothetical protein